MTRRVVAVVALAGLLLAACSGAGPGGASNTVAFIPDYQPGGGTTAAAPQGYAPADQPIVVGLGETDATHMFIDLSQPFASQGTVSFVVTNAGTETHEFVVLRTDSPAGSFPIVSFEGEPNRIDEDAKGVSNVGETGDMEPGATMTLSLDLAPGHYAVVCNLAGHYAMGMHQDFNVVPAGSTPITVSLGETDPTHMFIDLSQPYAPEGKVTFIITNTGAEDHEFVVLATDTPAADFPITGFDGEPNRFDEDAKGLTNVGETGDPAMAPGTSMMLTIDMSAGHYAGVCNLAGHYAMGMHQDIWITPVAATV
ncbi:MAG: sulfocyanin-like copper-binding protein [Actinomycetota bacterium]